MYIISFSTHHDCLNADQLGRLGVCHQMLCFVLNLSTKFHPSVCNGFSLSFPYSSISNHLLCVSISACLWFHWHHNFLFNFGISMRPGNYDQIEIYSSIKKTYIQKNGVLFRRQGQYYFIFFILYCNSPIYSYVITYSYHYLHSHRYILLLYLW